MKAHPLAERYPLMDGAEFDAFKADILANGCREPIRRYQGLILDGRNRYRACSELGVRPPFEDFHGTDEEAAAAVDSWNLHRRHLTAEFRRQRVADMRAAGMSLRKIAAALGAGVETVRRDLAAGVSNGTPAQPTTENATDATADATGTTGSEGGGSGNAGGTTRPTGGRATGNDRPVTAQHQPTERQPPARNDPPVAPPKVTGLDGKQYAATRPQAKPASKPAPAAPAPPSWGDLAERLAGVARDVDRIPNQLGDVESWRAVEALEATAKSLLRAASRLRKSGGL